jgi:hypothetical protein
VLFCSLDNPQAGRGVEGFAPQYRNGSGALDGHPNFTGFDSRDQNRDIVADHNTLTGSSAER